MRRPPLRIVVLLTIVIGSIGVLGGRADQERYTASFGIVRSDTLVSTGGNLYFSLEPGTIRELEGEDDNQPTLVRTTVLDRTQPVQFRAVDGWMNVDARVVEEREWVNGELAQVSLNYLAFCPRTGNIYYLGEDVDHYEDGIIVSHEDSWLAGIDGAQPGLLFPGSFLLGSRYYQELAPGISMDRAENIAMGVTFQTPAGTFNNCVIVLETTPLEPDEEVLKVYAPSVGLIADGEILLTRFSP